MKLTDLFTKNELGLVLNTDKVALTPFGVLGMLGKDDLLIPAENKDHQLIPVDFTTQTILLSNETLSDEQQFIEQYPHVRQFKLSYISDDKKQQEVEIELSRNQILAVIPQVVEKACA